DFGRLVADDSVPGTRLPLQRVRCRQIRSGAARTALAVRRLRALEAAMDAGRRARAGAEFLEGKTERRAGVAGAADRSSGTGGTVAQRRAAGRAVPARTGRRVDRVQPGAGEHAVHGAHDGARDHAPEMD